jgi:hypothetical protein
MKTRGDRKATLGIEAAKIGIQMNSGNTHDIWCLVSPTENNRFF